MRWRAIVLLALGLAGCGEPEPAPAPLAPGRGRPLVEMGAPPEPSPPAETRAPPERLEDPAATPIPTPAATPIPAAPEPTAVPSTPAPAKQPAEPANGEPLTLTWDDIASYEMDAPTIEPDKPDANQAAIALADAQIPEQIRALDGRRVRIEGFMLPVEVVKGRLLAFILVRHVMGCCFGAIPKLNEFVYVVVGEPSAVSPVSYDQIVVTGHLDVGGVLDQANFIYTVYQINDGAIWSPR